MAKLRNKIMKLYYQYIEKKNNVLSEEIIYNGVPFFINRGDVTIGEGTVINSGKNANVIGGDTRTNIIVLDGGRISIGKNCGISNSTIVARKSVIIEDNVMIGGNCKIYDNDFHSICYQERISGLDGIKAEKIIIREGAFIGAHSIILKGVTIGAHSVIGAGSVVTKDIPTNEIWAGNPARFIKSISDCVSRS